MSDTKTMPQKAAPSPSTRSADFRKSLTKLLPGYTWTVHRPIGNLRATGIQSSGFNRLSTLEVTMKSDEEWFEARIVGYGTRCQWLQSGCGGTLARAIRSLQDGLENQAQIYRGQANTVQSARTQPNNNRPDKHPTP